MIKVGIVGVTGYAGIELLRLLQQHPQVVVTKVCTDSYVGQPIASVYPHLAEFTALTGEAFNLEEIIKHCEVVFLCLPHGHAISMVQPLLDAGIKVIDLGPDFRLSDPAVYEHWYQQTPAANTLLEQAVYGLPEQGYKTAIAAGSLIANPGCYPTASLLASFPALKAGIIDPKDCLFDAKSGVSGGGRSLSLTNHFCEMTENLIPYQLAGKHRHTPEIEQALSALAEFPVTIQFTPHLVPMIRGLLVTAYFKLTQPLSQETIHALYETHYQNEPFIRIAPLNTVPQVKQVRGTNYCDIGIAVDERTHRLVVVSVIDNLIKGAAGQAIQNMNLMLQLPETTGLQTLCTAYP